MKNKIMCYYSDEESFFMIVDFVVDGLTIIRYSREKKVRFTNEVWFLTEDLQQAQADFNRWWNGEQIISGCDTCLHRFRCYTSYKAVYKPVGHGMLEQERPYEFQPKLLSDPICSILALVEEE